MDRADHLSVSAASPQNESLCPHARHHMAPCHQDRGRGSGFHSGLHMGQKHFLWRQQLTEASSNRRSVLAYFLHPTRKVKEGTAQHDLQEYCRSFQAIAGCVLTAIPSLCWYFFFFFTINEPMDCDLWTISFPLFISNNIPGEWSPDSLEQVWHMMCPIWCFPNLHTKMEFSL